MRVAGSVIWATDLTEGEQTTGAKGQPDVTYSYSVSLAVALSSRPVGAIGRIWADGKLLRGVEGDFKVPTTFRFYDGSESQEIDPLIASIEGIDNTPAYRGLALAVFENLELAAFGNRIPFLTFELIADTDPPSISAIMTDASAGSIASDASQSLIGYAAYGRSIAAAVQSLVEAFDVPLFDDGSMVRGPIAAPPTMIGAEELGNGADGQKASRIQREQLPIRSVPSALRLSYYDPDREYQTGEARAIAGEQGINEVQQELPAVLHADDAKALVQQMLTRQWSARDRLTIRLPPARVALEPGSIAEPAPMPGEWVVEKCSVEGFVTIAELRPWWQPSVSLAAEPGRIVPNSDVVEAPTSLALIEAPNLMAPQSSGSTILIAASSPNSGWIARPLTVTSSGQTFASQTPVRKSFLGSALTALAASQAHLIDEISIVDIELVDEQQWLTSCDDDALADGANLAILGSELVQFGAVEPLGNGRFRLSHLLRGRGGTEWASASHAAGELFCLLDGNSVRPLALPAWMRGSAVGAQDRTGSSASMTFGAEAVRPLSPVGLRLVFDASGALVLNWTRRSRDGFAWLDEVDAPIGESREQYHVTIKGAAADLEITTGEPSAVVGALELEAFGGGSATVEVRQGGDWAASRPAQLTIELPQE